MARFDDALVGWEVFRERGGNVSRPQLNAAIRERGKEPIAERTYRHYQKLQRLGYQEYVSINRLDIRHANDTIFDVSDRSRYLDHELDSPGRLVLPVARGVDLLPGQVIRISEGFASLRVARSPEAERAAKASKYNRGVLVLDQVGVERAVEVVEAAERDDHLELLLQFRSLLETDLVLPPSSLPVSTSRFVVDLGPDPSIFQVLQVMHGTFDLFESSRGFAELALTGAGRDVSPLPTLRVRHLEVSNPVEFIVMGSLTVMGLVTFVVNRVSQSVTNAAGAASAIQNVAHDRSDERRKQEKHDVEMESLQLGNLKQALEISSMIENLGSAVDGLDGLDVAQLDSPTIARLEALKDQAVEAGSELAITSRSEIVIDDVGEPEGAEDAGGLGSE